MLLTASMIGMGNGRKSRAGFVNSNNQTFLPPIRNVESWKKKMIMKGYKFQ